jgi:hypothetical protein
LLSRRAEPSQRELAGEGEEGVRGPLQRPDEGCVLAGVEVGALFREFEKGVRVSLRSNRIPILSVAETFAAWREAEAQPLD